MPQAPRKDNQAQRLQDKEAKRERGALSCAECRRLKLKCDKTVPCSSCKRRGCSAICPNGKLITGQGTRFVLADTAKLHQKISQMSDRIRQLEDALAIAQSALTGPTGEPHPLLDRELLKIRSSIELHSAATNGAGLGGEEVPELGAEEDADDEHYIDAFGTLAIRDGGAATFFGRSAGQESLLIGEVSLSNGDHSSDHRQYGLSNTSSYSDIGSEPQIYVHQQYYTLATDTTLPNNVANLAQAFPLAPPVPPSLPNPHEPVTLSMLRARYLPPYQEGLRLIQLYLEQAPWFFGAVTEKQIEDEVLPMWYEEEVASDRGPGSNSLPGVSAGKQKERTGTSHDLALLFMIFCFGSLTDMNLPAPPDNPLSDKFYQLSKAALTLDPSASPGAVSAKNGVLDRPPSVATVQTLSLMAIYEGLCSGENSIESTWVLFGFATKLSQSIGLHRDSARWKLSPAEVQKRRALFWELFITDCWQSLATGRLATYSLPFVDCELPFDPDQTIAEDGSTQSSFPFWKARFGAECVSAVVQGTLTSRAPKYSIILDLDRKVRDMELPLYAHGEPPQGKGLRQTMSHFMPQNYRELTLLYIHRCFFAHAISSNPLDPVKSQYAPSFLAGYRSSCTILSAVKQQFTLFPAQIARFWVLWTHAFSASIMLASVATHASRSKIAPAALLELKIACDLFEEASRYGGRAGKFLPILKRLQMKAQQSYRDANSGMPSNIPNDIFKPSRPDDANDELSIFSGKTHTVNTTSTPTISSSGRSPQPTSSRGDSPQQILTDNPSFVGVHPSLISELSSFQPLIRQQVQNAYRIGGDVFGGAPIVIDPIRRIPAGQPNLPAQSQLPLSVVVQQRSQQPPQFQQQQQREQERRQAILHQQELEHERFEQERRELERQELERRQYERQELQRQELEKQEFARQKLLEYQRQQAQQEEMRKQQEIRLQELRRQQEAEHEAIRRHEAQEERRRQEEKAQIQRQEQYRQQLEIQQLHFEQQQQQHMVQYQHEVTLSQQQTMYALRADVQDVAVSTTVPSQMPPPATNSMYATHNRQVLHSQSSSGLRQIYQQLPVSQGTGQITPQQSGVSAQAITPQHTSSQSQRPIYTVPQTKSAAQQSSDSMDTTTGYVQPTTTSYGQSHPSSASAVPASHFLPDAYKYWPAASTSFALPLDQSGAISGFALTPLQPEPRYQHQQYSPDSALRGIAADDRSLQETWQSYMNKVGSPRQFFED